GTESCRPSRSRSRRARAAPRTADPGVPPNRRHRRRTSRRQRRDGLPQFSPRMRPPPRRTTLITKGTRMTALQLTAFHDSLASAERSADIPEASDVYGWLCGSWDLVVVRYAGVDVSARRLTGEVHAARVLEGRAVQDVWIMPRPVERKGAPQPGMDMFGTTLRSWDPKSRTWRIAWTNPVSGHCEIQSGN